jgi:hypothetical protein
MCEFPSWIIDKDGKAHWLVDHDIVQAIEDGKLKSWDDATGHSALEKVLGCSGKHCEGREGLPEGFASDIRSGRCNRMARVEPKQALSHVLDLLPPGLQLFGSKIEGDLDLRGCDLKGITLPTSVGGGLDLSGCDLKGITLPTSVGGGLDLEGAKNITLPVGLTIGGNLDLTQTDVESLPHGFSIKGEIIGKNLPIPPKDAPKQKRRVKAKAKRKAGKRGGK